MAHGMAEPDEERHRVIIEYQAEQDWLEFESDEPPKVGDLVEAEGWIVRLDEPLGTTPAVFFGTLIRRMPYSAPAPSPSA